MLPLNEEEARALDALRKRARRRGIIVKSSRQPIGPMNLGGFTVIDASRQAVIAGQTFDLSVAAADRVVTDHLMQLEAEFLAKAALVR